MQESIRLQQLQTTLEAELDSLQSSKLGLDSALAVSREENQILLGELISAKMAVGNLSTELDEAKRQLHLLRVGSVVNHNVMSTLGGVASGGVANNGGSSSRKPPPISNIFAHTATGE